MLKGLGVTESASRSVKRRRLSPKGDPLNDCEKFLATISSFSVLPVKDRRQRILASANLFDSDLSPHMFRRKGDSLAVARLRLHRYSEAHGAWNFTHRRLFALGKKLFLARQKMLKTAPATVKKLHRVASKRANIFVNVETVVKDDLLTKERILWARTAVRSNTAVVGCALGQGKPFSSSLYIQAEKFFRRIGQLNAITRQKLYRIMHLSRLVGPEMTLAFRNVFTNAFSTQGQDKSNIRQVAIAAGFDPKKLGPFFSYLRSLPEFDQFVACLQLHQVSGGYATTTSEQHLTSVRKLYTRLRPTDWSLVVSQVSRAIERVFYRTRIPADAIPFGVLNEVIPLLLYSGVSSSVIMCEILIVAIVFMLRINEVISLQRDQIHFTAEFVFITILQGKSTRKERLSLHIRVKRSLRPFGLSLEHVLQSLLDRHSANIFVFHSRMKKTAPISNYWLTDTWRMFANRLQIAYEVLENLYLPPHCWRVSGINALRALGLDTSLALQLSRHVWDSTQKQYERLDTQLKMQQWGDNDLAFLDPVLARQITKNSKSKTSVRKTYRNDWNKSSGKRYADN